MARIYALLIILAILGGCGYGVYLYYKDTQARIATLRTNNANLESSNKSLSAKITAMNENAVKQSIRNLVLTDRGVPRPKVLSLKDANIVVITEKNLNEVIQRVKNMQGSFVVYALDPKSFEALAINMEEIKLYIEEQNKIILYYEKSVTEELDKTQKKQYNTL